MHDVFAGHSRIFGGDMEAEKPISLAELKDEIEECWSLFDELFEILNENGGWDGKHGKDWTFADVPYHLAYFDRAMVLEPIEAGAGIPEEQRWELRKTNEVDAWNEREFAKRPAGQTVSQSLEQMRAVREELREIVAGMNEADLGGKIWYPLGLFRGWRTARLALEGCRNHTMSEFIQLRTLMKRDKPAPSAGLMHDWLTAMFGLIGSIANPDAAGDKPFTMVWTIAAPGGGPWTFHVEDGDFTVTEGHTRKADLEMSLSPRYFGVMFGMQNPVMGLLTRNIKIRGFRHLGKMGKIMTPPDPDAVIEPVETAGASG
jgi:hypothetical protein